MAYVGGKATKYKHITGVLNLPCFDGMPYLEPFVGYAHILRRVINKKSYTAADLNTNVYNLLTFVQQTNKPYPKISEEAYFNLKHDLTIINRTGYTLPVLKGFAAFAYSYGGKEWGGWSVTDKKQTRFYVRERENYYNLLRSNEQFMSCTLLHTSYELLTPRLNLIYCDPPYQPLEDGETYYAKVEDDFDHDAFWEQIRLWSGDNVVFVSEYSAPADFVLVASLDKRSTLSNKAENEEANIRTENLFAYQPMHDALMSLVPEYKLHFMLNMPKPYDQNSRYQYRLAAPAA